MIQHQTDPNKSRFNTGHLKRSLREHDKTLSHFMHELHFDVLIYLILKIEMEIGIEIKMYINFDINSFIQKTKV